MSTKSHQKTHGLRIQGAFHSPWLHLPPSSWSPPEFFAVMRPWRRKFPGYPFWVVNGLLMKLMNYSADDIPNDPSLEYVRRFTQDKLQTYIYIKVCSTTHGANGIDHPWKNTHQHCQHLDFELIHLHSCLRAWEVESQNRILDSWVMLLSVKIPLNIPIVSIGICPITVNIYSNIPRFHIDFPVLPLKHLCFNQIKMIPIQYTHHMPSLIAGPPIGVRSYNPSALFVERWGSWQPSDEPPAVGTSIHHP